MKGVITMIDKIEVNLIIKLLKYSEVLRAIPFGLPEVTITRDCYKFKNTYIIQKGTVDNMNTPKFILHTTSTFIKDGAHIEDAQDIISLIDYFNLTKEKYHFDILTIDGYIDCFKLFLEHIGTEYEETIESMLSEYQRYLRGDCNE